MSNSDKQKNSPQGKKRPATKAIRTGHKRTQEAEHSEPLFLTSSFVFEDTSVGQARMAEGEQGNVYSRYTNPTVATFEARIADMESAEAGVATASGMAAILSICLAFLKAGDHIVCSRDVFGSTTILLTKYMAKFGVEVTFVSLTNLDEWRSAIKSNTRIMFVETPSNPLNEVADISALAELANDMDVKLVVDNCFCTPALQRPIELGAHMVMHSATKYLDGQGRCLGGSVVGSDEDMAEVLGVVRTAGPAMSAFNAWVFLKGLETLYVRMKAHCENAMALARWLESRPEVEQVFYCGLESHPGHALASKQQSGFGGVLSFRVAGGKDQAWNLVNNTELMSLTPNLGDTKTTIIHPATTTHGRLTDEQRQIAGITDNLVRISVGLEALDDLTDDLMLGFSAL